MASRTAVQGPTHSKAGNLGQVVPRATEKAFTVKVASGWSSATRGLRFQSMVPFIRDIVLSLANIAAAVARTGVRAHMGNLMLALHTSAIQKARSALCLRVCIARLGNDGTLLSFLPCVGAWLARQQGWSSHVGLLCMHRSRRRGWTASQPGARASCLPSQRGGNWCRTLPRWCAASAWPWRHGRGTCPSRDSPVIPKERTGDTVCTSRWGCSPACAPHAHMLCAMWPILLACISLASGSCEGVSAPAF